MPMRAWFTAVVGALLGAVVGFVLRPSLPLIGQLPPDVVFNRGASLHGLDALVLRSAAQQSFNDVVLGAIAGLVAGLLLGLFTSRR